MKQSTGALRTFQSAQAGLERQGETTTIQVENNFNGFTVTAWVSGGKFSRDTQEARFHRSDSRSGSPPRALDRSTCASVDANRIGTNIA